MMKVLTCICLAAFSVGVAFAADQGDRVQDKTKSDLNDLKSALNSLQLTPQERTQTAGLRDNFDKQLGDAVERLKAAMAEKLVADLRTALNDDHRQQLDSLLAALKRRDAAIAIADQQVDNQLAAVKLGDLKLSKASVRSEQQLVEKICLSDKAIREKFMAAKATYDKQETDETAKLAAPDPKDKAANKAHQESKKKIKGSAEAGLLQEARALLNDGQRAAIAQVAEAMRQWEAALKAAKDTYEQDRKTLLGDPAKAAGKGKAGAVMRKPR